MSRLPSGSSRDVFLATDATGRQVVLKVLGAPQRNEGLFDPAIADEVSAYARLSHPNLVRVVDVFSSDGRFVIAMEFVDGCSLDVLEAALRGMARDRADACALYVASCLFAALAAAHEGQGADAGRAPVLHRNVSPANILVAWDGTVKLGNFNVANVVTALHDSNGGFRSGSYGYFAPEQVRLETASAATDVYSAMLIVWELLTGRKAIERDGLSDVELLDVLAAPRIASLGALRPSLDARVLQAVRTGLERDPRKRTLDAARARDVFRSATDEETARRCLADALARVRSSRESPPAPPPSLPRMPEAVPAPSALVRSRLDSTTPLGLEIERPLDRRQRIAKLAALATLGLGGSFFITAVALRLHVRSPHPASAPAAARGVEARPLGSVSAPVVAPGARAVASDANIPPGTGEIQPPSSAAGHRIFVDGRVVGQGTKPIALTCSRHAVRIGSAGRTQLVDVPCGETVALSR